MVPRTEDHSPCLFLSTEKIYPPPDPQGTPVRFLRRKFVLDFLLLLDPRTVSERTVSPVEYVLGTLDFLRLRRSLTFRPHRPCLTVLHSTLFSFPLTASKSSAPSRPSTTACHDSRVTRISTVRRVFSTGRTPVVAHM